MAITALIIPLTDPEGDRVRKTVPEDWNLAFTSSENGAQVKLSLSTLENRNHSGELLGSPRGKESLSPLKTKGAYPHPLKLWSF